MNDALRNASVYTTPWAACAAQKRSARNAQSSAVRMHRAAAVYTSMKCAKSRKR
jgi:hypothetical protein